MNSATKKNTRDVGMTFPTPRSSQVRPQKPSSCADGGFGQLDGGFSDFQNPPGKEKLKGQPSNFLMDKKTGSNRPQLPQGQIQYCTFVNGEVLTFHISQHILPVHNVYIHEISSWPCKNSF